MEFHHFNLLLYILRLLFIYLYIYNTLLQSYFPFSFIIQKITSSFDRHLVGCSWSGSAVAAGSTPEQPLDADMSPIVQKLGRLRWFWLGGSAARVVGTL